LTRTSHRQLSCELASRAGYLAKAKKRLFDVLPGRSVAT